jgi:hypothetical protein
LGSAGAGSSGALGAPGRPFGASLSLPDLAGAEVAASRPLPWTPVFDAPGLAPGAAVVSFLGSRAFIRLPLPMAMGGPRARSASPRHDGVGRRARERRRASAAHGRFDLCTALSSSPGPPRTRARPLFGQRYL